MVSFPGIRKIGATQVTNAGTTSNDADSDIVNALANPRAETVDASNAFTITNVDPTWLWERNVAWRFTDAASAPTAQITVTVPATPARGIFGVINATGQDMAVEISGQPLTAPVIPAGEAGVLSSDGANVELLSSGGGGAAAFDDLTDTPANKTGSANKLLQVNGAETAIQYGPAAGVVTVTPPWRGATLILDADKTAQDFDPRSKVPWDSAHRDTDSFADLLNDQFVIPAGITRVSVTGQVALDSASSLTQFLLEIFVNGATAGVIRPLMRLDPVTDQLALQVHAPLLDVVLNDTIDLQLTTIGDSSVTLSFSDSWFHLDVVETDEAAKPPESLKAHVTTADKLVISSTVAMWLADRQINLADDFAGSLGYAKAGPNGGSVVFDVEVEGTKIGEITFADSTGAAQTATFSTTGATEETVAVGERLEIVAPANLQSMDDVAFTLQAWRS